MDEAEARRNDYPNFILTIGDDGRRVLALIQPHPTLLAVTCRSERFLNSSGPGPQLRQSKKRAIGASGGSTGQALGLEGCSMKAKTVSYFHLAFAEAEHLVDG